MMESARNVTPDQLPAAAREALQSVCDRHLRRLIAALTPEWVIGVGAYAERCAQRVLRDWGTDPPRVGRILHPSPASPAANRDWAGEATRELTRLGIWRDAASRGS